ncbi:MAG: phage portal protein [Alphaproteobacteria bacterium]|jgi:HK97 family phage portal protein|nr:phage portal protein [Alphaproteobacteria bacterium]
MPDYLKSFFSKGRKQSTKSSSVGPLVACGTVGNPVWTPRRYDSLAAEGYQKNVIVYRCVNLIARGLSSVPWLLYKDDEELAHHPLLTLLNAPSPRQAGSAFMESVVGFLLLSGNTYIEAVHDHEGRPVELHPLRPDRMKIIPGSGGIPSAYEYSVAGQHKILPCDPVTGHSSILHLKNFHPLNDWYGMSPIEAAARSIDQHNAVAGHNLALLQNGGRPSGGLIVRPSPNSRGMSDEQRDSLRQDLKEVYAGHKNAGQILVLEGDCEWKEMGLSPKDLDFIEGKKLTAREISQAYGVPPMLVGVAGDATFANYKEARFHLWEDTIIPLLEFFVAEFNLWLAPAFDEKLSLSYNTDEIPALSARREAVWSKIASANFLTINEKRQAVGYGPIPDGDRIFHP